MAVAAQTFNNLVGNVDPQGAFAKGAQLRSVLDAASAHQVAQSFDMLMANVRRNDLNRQEAEQQRLREQALAEKTRLDELKFGETTRLNDAKIAADTARAGWYDRRGTGTGEGGADGIDPNVAAAISGDDMLPRRPETMESYGHTPTVSATGDPGLVPPLPGQEPPPEAVKQRNDLVNNSVSAHKSAYSRTPEESMSFAEATQQEREDADNILRLTRDKSVPAGAVGPQAEQQPGLSDEDQILRLMAQARSYMAQTPTYRTKYQQSYATNQERLARLLEKTDPVNLIVNQAENIDEGQIALDVAKDPIYRKHLASAAGGGQFSDHYVAAAAKRAEEITSKRRLQNLEEGFASLEDVLNQKSVGGEVVSKALRAKQKLLGTALGRQAYNAFQTRQQTQVEEASRRAKDEGLEQSSVTIGVNSAGKPFKTETFKAPKAEEAKGMTDAQLLGAERSLSATYAKLVTDPMLAAAQTPTASEASKRSAGPIQEELKTITERLKFIREELDRRRKPSAPGSAPAPSTLQTPKGTGKMTPASFYGN